MAKKWYPVVDILSCIECGTCVNFCSHGVYDKKNAPTGRQIIIRIPRMMPPTVFNAFLSVRMATAIFFRAAATVALISGLLLCQT